LSRGINWQDVHTCVSIIGIVVLRAWLGLLEVLIFNLDKLNHF